MAGQENDSLLQSAASSDKLKIRISPYNLVQKVYILTFYMREISGKWNTRG